MDYKEVFFAGTEIKRLKTQMQLFCEYEQPIYQKLLVKNNLCVLDIGSNNGKKTTEKFGVPCVDKVIGLEYHKGLSHFAEKHYGSEKFSFYQSNVEDEDFTEFVGNIMREKNISGFDIINMSLVLMHLKNPGALLSRLKPLLNPGGKLVILEADDSASYLKPDENSLLKEFFRILSTDKFAGDRRLATELDVLLKKCGYACVESNELNVSATGKEKRKKKDIYDVFFSYLLPDIKILLKQDPLNKDYLSGKEWLAEHGKELKALICNSESTISMGMRMFICSEE